MLVLTSPSPRSLNIQPPSRVISPFLGPKYSLSFFLQIAVNSRTQIFQTFQTDICIFLETEFILNNS